MGNVIPVNPPEGCPDCKAGLPDVIGAVVIVPGIDTFSGVFTKIGLGFYEGTFYDGGGLFIVGELYYCYSGESAYIEFGSVGGVRCGDSLELGVGCFGFIGMTSGGCVFFI